MRYDLALVETKDYDVLIDRRKIFDQPIRINFITYDKI